ncbi:MAG: hypothetical protein K1W41_21465 [Lachnospiraceae bacterium]
MADFNAQFFGDLIMMLFALALLGLFITVFVLIIILLVKAIKKQDKLAEMHENEK